jgi:uncharacterized protein (TIGR02996 family)
MDRETSLLTQLAERPDDRALRLVFADWLQEQGDPRGELIALCARGELSLTEQRKVARLTQQHARAWLGPLARIADLHRTRFKDGFLSELVCAPQLAGPGDVALLGAGRARIREEPTLRANLFEALTGEPRLATVRALSLPPPSNDAPHEVGGFLGHRYLSRVERLELGAIDWRALRGHELPDLRPGRVVLASWGAFDGELAGLETVPVVARAESIALSTTDFTNAPTVQRIIASVSQQLRAVQHFKEIQLHSHYGPVEGSADWLVAGDDAANVLPQLDAWSLEASEVGFVRMRREDRRLSHLLVDLSLPEATTGEKQAVDRGRPPMVMRLHTAAMVMSLLRSKRIRSVEVKLPPGGRLRSTERHTLFVEARKWGTLEKFVVGGEETTLP